MIETTRAGVVDHGEHTGPLVTHFSEDGQLVLLEILDASEFLSALIKGALRGEEELTLAVG